LYLFEENSILIVAIAHQHRVPDYWIDKRESSQEKEKKVPAPF
jgi:hypothetical protein